jgi:very-short-patch-repair endonuclease
VRDARREGVEEISAWVGYRPELVAIVARADAAGLISWTLSGFPRSLAELERALPQGLPGIFARVSVGASSAVFDPIVSTLIRVAEAAPRVELALAVTQSELAAWRQRADARERHLVGEGLIEIEAAAARKGESQQRRSAGARGAIAVAPDHVKVAGCVASRLEYDAAEFARSRAERTLFEHLEARARTQGLFRLNGTIPEPFGGRDLEVDLLSEELRVALEIDGYHHFRDSVAYRRDRDKDVRLQRLGYTVVRVLATDVDVELDYVTDTIDRVVDHEKQKRAP